MTTNQKLWGKVILSSYNYLKRLCDSIDCLIENTAVNSYYNFNNLNGNSIENIAKNIISYSNRKIDYINLKIITEKALKTLPKQYAKILILKFIQKIHIEELCNLLHISKRACYRKLDTAIKLFISSLNCLGYTIEKLELDYSSDPFIKSVLKLIEKNNYLMQEKADVISNDSVFNNYISSLLASLV